MEGNTNVEIRSAIRNSVFALVAVLGVPAAIYFGLRDPFGAGTANGLALGSSVIVALAVVTLLLWQRE